MLLAHYKFRIRLRRRLNNSPSPFVRSFDGRVHQCWQSLVSDFLVARQSDRRSFLSGMDTDEIHSDD